MMLQQPQSDTYILATNQTHQVRDFVSLAFSAVDIQLEWSGVETDEVGVDVKTGKILVKVDPRFYRPAEVDLLIGDPAKAFKDMGWQAQTSLEDLCQMMVQADIRRNQMDISF